MPVIYENYFDTANDLAITKLPDGRDEVDIGLNCGGQVEVVDGKLKCSVYPSSLDCAQNPEEAPRAQFTWIGGRYYHPIDLYVQSKMFIPNDYNLSSGGWDYVYDFHVLEPGVTYHNLPKLFIKQRGHGLVTWIPYMELGGPIDSVQTIPKNQWITWTMRYKLGVSDGVWQVWQDNVLVWDLQDVNTACTYPTANEISSVEIKTYTSRNEPDGLHKFFNDFIISTDPLPFDIVPPTQTNLIVDSNPIGIPFTIEKVI